MTRREATMELFREAHIPRGHVARRLVSEDHSLNWDIAYEAATYISRLTIELRDAIQNAIDAKESAMEDIAGAMDALERKMHEVAAERDEARRMFCEILARHESTRTPQRIAERRGWDCYKEDGE